MKIRIIGKEDCKYCNALRQSYSMQQVDFEYWDGDKDELQDQLDEMGIINMPVIQIVDDKEQVLWASDPIIYPRGMAYIKVKKIMNNLTKRIV